MAYDIRPFHGIGPITFGMDRSEVRKTLPAPFEEYRQNEFANNTSDAFDNIGVTVHYDQDNKCECISIWSDEEPVTFQERAIFKENPSQIVEWIKVLDGSAKLGGENTLTSTLYCMSIGFDGDPSDPDASISDITLFTKRYYETNLKDYV